MYRIYLILLFFSVNLFSQMLPMEERYKQIYKNIEKKEYNEKLVNLTAIALENRDVVNEAGEALSNAYENKILRSRLIILFVNIIYDIENSERIKKIFNDLLKDREFKTAIVKIIKSEKNSKKIFNLLKQYFIKKLDKRFDKIFKTYLMDKFLCQTNIDTVFKVIAKKFLSDRLKDVVYNYYKENKIEDKYSNRFKQQLVSLPYDYSIDGWFEKVFDKNYKKIKKLLTSRDNFNLFINDNLKSIVLDIVYSTMSDENFLKFYKKDFYNEFFKDDLFLKRILKSLLIDDNEQLFDKIKEKRFNCFHLEQKMIKIDEGLLIIYLKSILSKKELESKVLPILYESLR